MTDDDIDQIVEGIERFIITGDPAVEEVWQRYLDKLAALKADLRVLGTAQDILDATICECSHLDGEHEFVNPESSDVADCHGNDAPGFGNCGCKEFRPVTFVVARAPTRAGKETPELLAAIKDYVEWGAMTGSDRDLFDQRFRAAIATADGRDRKDPP